MLPSVTVCPLIWDNPTAMIDTADTKNLFKTLNFNGYSSFEIWDKNTGDFKAILDKKGLLLEYKSECG